MRRIIGIAGISIWAALIIAAVIWGFKGAGPAQTVPQESGIESTSIEILAKDLVSALSSGDCEKATENFDRIMKKTLTAEKLQQFWNSLIAQLGPFVEQAGTRRGKILRYDVIFVTCKFEKGPLDAKVVFNDKQQVAGLFFVPSQPAK
ncbi:MAG: DUF3887 domain-containing protein [Phycisphaerae bacterium]|nr:DUF3887 domain-containing protein [Phycisphaerae bacterium]MDD5380426.1 DUF3887 domain-containing protein [Phycisphaerae bacterium]